MNSNFKLFNGGTLKKYLSDKLATINKLPIQVYPNMTNADIATKAFELARQYEVGTLKIDFDSRSSDITMRDVLGARFPGEYDVERNRNYPRAYVNYKFSFTGYEKLLSFSPETVTFQHQIDAEFYYANHIVAGFSIGYQTLSSSIELSDEVADKVKSFMKPIIDAMPAVQTALNKEIDDFNKQLEPLILKQLQERLIAVNKQEAIKRSLNDF